MSLNETIESAILKLQEAKELVNKAMGYAQQDDKRPAMVIKACQLAAEYYGIKGIDITCRATSMVFPQKLHNARHLAMLLLWSTNQLSLTQIAWFFNLADHSSVMSGRNKARQRMSSDPKFNRDATTMLKVFQEYVKSPNVQATQS